MKSKLTSVTMAAACLALLGATSSLRAATITVTSTADSGPGSLRAALASAAGGDTINFGVTGKILLTSGRLLVNKNLTILGPGPSSLAVDGNATNCVFEIYSGTTATIAGLTITNGYSTSGGGIGNYGSLTLVNSTLSGNSALWDGGGICNGGQARLTVSNCTLSGNSAAYGSGIYNFSSESSFPNVQIVNSTLSGNSATGAGGDGCAICNQSGCYSGSASVKIVSCTLSGNVRGGIVNVSGCSVQIGNSILKTGALGINIYGSVTSLGHNLSSDAAGGWLTAPGDHINTDPMLGPLQDNGGGTPTNAPLYGSPALDAAGLSGCPATDQRGVPRPQGSACDIGAYEETLIRHALFPFAAR